MSSSTTTQFLWGAATAAYQIEGGAVLGGRGRSIWDTFSGTPGKTLNGDTGDIAADHVHCWRDDIALMKELGLQAYRFSISWPRVQPEGTGEFNPAGVAFYSNLVDGLLEVGIEPIVTLYHWDLPQTLEDNGGWANRETAYAFAAYARGMAALLGDRVSRWTTMNEPWCSAFLGYANGVHAPGRTEPVVALAAAHHLNLGHGLAAEAIREATAGAVKVSITLNLHVVDPADPDDSLDVDAARRIDAVGNRIFLGPLLGSGYPQDLLDDLGHITNFPFVGDGDEAIIGAPLDELGINYYATSRVRARRGDGQPQRADGHGDGSSPWVGADMVEFLPQPGPFTAMGWNVEPDGLYRLLMRVHRENPDLPMMITENGAAYRDTVSADGAIHDPERTDYIRRHIAAALRARADGADVRGYMVWSLLDNFEWSFGYDRRFGVVHVDFRTQMRTIKDSGLWYAGLLEAAVDGDATVAQYLAAGAAQDRQIGAGSA